jgi:Lar family restriction alleviation protein
MNKKETVAIRPPVDKVVMQDLLPCPFCGETFIRFIGVRNVKYMACSGCGARGPESKDMTESWANWNVRPGKVDHQWLPSASDMEDRDE